MSISGYILSQFCFIHIVQKDAYCIFQIFLRMVTTLSCLGSGFYIIALVFLRFC